MIPPNTSTTDVRGTQLLEQPAPTINLREEASQTLDGLRCAVAAVVSAVPGSVRKAADLQRALGLDPALGWSVFRVATAEDPLAAIPYVPKSSAMTRFLRAAERNGVPRNLIERAEQELERFDHVVQTHADDRETFDAMIGGGKEVDLRDRRAAHRLNARIWGEQCKSRLSLGIVHPGLAEGMADVIYIRGFIGMTKTRDAAGRVRVLRFRMWESNEEVTDAVQRTVSPLVYDGRPDDEYAGILTDFCSRPLPTVRRFTDEKSFLCTELGPSQLGKTGATTYFVGERMQNIMSCPLPTKETVGFTTYVREPTEVLVRDLIVHDSVWDGPPPEAAIYGSLDPVVNGQRPVFQEENRMSCGERVVELGRGIDALHSPEVPRYADMAAYIFEKSGFDHRQYRVFRCRVEYPVLQTCVRIVFNPKG